MSNKNGFVPFKGSVDDLLNHCASIDSEAMTRVLDGKDEIYLNHDESIETVMAEYKVDKETATEIVEEIEMSELENTLNNTSNQIIGLSFDEAVQRVMDLYDLDKDKSTQLVSEILVKEIEHILDSNVKVGLMSKNQDNKYILTEKGIKNTKKKKKS